MNKNTGFTLIEILVAVVVLAIGLLGLAALQASSLKSNQSAYNRSQATELAHEITDRIRANIAATNIAGVNAYDSGAALENKGCLDATKGCSAAEMAGNDLYEWNAAVAAALPSGQGVVCLDTSPGDGTDASNAKNGCDGAGSTYAVKIWWDDDRSGKLQQFVTSFSL